MKSRSLFLGVPAIALAGAAALIVTRPLAAAERVVKAPPPALLAAADGKQQTAIFAGGCFWGVEGVFEHVRGVRNVISGYAGGTAKTARYEMVGSGRTGHAESVRVVFDPKQVNYAELLRVYFSVAHDPTQLNRQGPDSGPQYRSALFPLNAEQARVARAYIAQLTKARTFDKPIVTKIESYTGFYAAEDYHQDFMVKNPSHPYILVNDQPKVRALRRLFPQAYRG